MKAEMITLIGCLLAASSAWPVEKQATSTPKATATLPLSEVLQLHRDLANSQKVAPETAPYRATITRFELRGRLLADGLDLTAHIDLSIMQTDGWVRIELLTLDSDTHLARLPQVPGGEFVLDGKSLVFVTNTTGRKSFELGLLKTARVEGKRRKLNLSFAGATLAKMVLRYDEGMFELESGPTLSSDQGTVLFPKGNRFELAWLLKGEVPIGPKPEKAPRPPIESVIESAHASVVATLEGRRIGRIQYQLRFEGTKQLTFELAPGPRVQKVYLNGAAIPFTAQGEVLELSVSPTRAGEQTARLELLLEESPGPFHLSGDQAFGFPKASWATNELFVDLHLPRVFNYRWVGGSMAPTSATPKVHYSQKMPTPGKQMRFRQQLVGGAADLRIAYDVDLAGKYYRGRFAPAPGPAAHQPQAVGVAPRSIRAEPSAVEPAWIEE